MLPSRDGWEILTEIRRAGQQTPVLMLTARDAVPDRVKGLELGADDYLVKPFAFSELLARSRSLFKACGSWKYFAWRISKSIYCGIGRFGMVSALT